MNTLKKPIQYYFFATMMLYIGIYSVFLFLSDFLPYVMDNNETYSSLVHAYNMYFGDWSQHFGLTDEAFSSDPAAHPVIHTHQGNWPRIYAYILFALGARAAESQILIHVFTIGLISIWLMYRFFNKITNSRFALLACAVLMTDYVLFAQWQVVTYRVWHCFFLFSSLNCVHEKDSKNRLSRILFILNFAALYYWELVFAFYVSVWSLLYYSYINKFNLIKTLRCGALISISGLLALTILFVQLSMFMGYENVLQDFYYTFLARNFSGDEATYRDVVKKFYESKDIVFFYNIVDGDTYKSVGRFLKSILQYGFQVHTPILGLFVFCYILAEIYRRASNFLQSFMHAETVPYMQAIYISAISYSLFSFSIFYDNSLLGLSDKSGYYVSSMSFFSLTFSVLFFSMAMSYFTFASVISSKHNITRINLIFSNLFIVSLAILVIILPKFYDQNLSEIWYSQLPGKISTNLWRIAFLCIVVGQVGRLLVNYSTDVNRNFVTGISSFLIPGIAAYAIVYILSPGYVYTGYLTRYAPFIVYIVDVMLCYLVWQMFATLKFQFQVSASYSALIKSSKRNVYNYLSILPRVSIFLVTFIVFISLFIYWGYIQYFYFRIFPPTSLSFVKELRHADFQNKSVISNQYTAPFAYETKHWAFMYGHMKVNPLQLNAELLDKRLASEYLWYKNKNVFPNYFQPEYIVCFMPNTFYSVLNELHNSVSRVGCSNSYQENINIVSKQENFNPNYIASVVRNDKSLRNSWAIIQLDWKR